MLAQQLLGREQSRYKYIYDESGRTEGIKNGRDQQGELHLLARKPQLSRAHTPCAGRVAAAMSHMHLDSYTSCMPFINPRRSIRVLLLQKNQNLLNGLAYLAQNLIFHNFSKFTYKAISNLQGRRWKLILQIAMLRFYSLTYSTLFNSLPYHRNATYKYG